MLSHDALTRCIHTIVHYPRVPPEDWDRVFKMAKEMGLNTIQTYVFWNFHEVSGFLIHPIVVKLMFL
jgi:hypothetical protein